MNLVKLEAFTFINWTYAKPRLHLNLPEVIQKAFYLIEMYLQVHRKKKKVLWTLLMVQGRQGFRVSPVNLHFTLISHFIFTIDPHSQAKCKMLIAKFLVNGNWKMENASPGGLV